jgi:hypothetical protein
MKMTPDDKEALYEFLKGAGVIFGVLASFILIVAVTVDWKKAAENKPNTTQDNFTVVDHYKECDIIRWEHNNFSEYKYFMKCPK